MNEKKEFTFKVLVVGDIAVGKTSIIRRYIHESFSQHYKLTIGVDFGLKVIHSDENTLIRIQLWDIAGQERFGNMTKIYYRDAAGAFVVFDVTRASSFAGAETWKKDLDSKILLSDGSKIPVVLLGNKCDQLDKMGLYKNQEEMDQFVAGNGFVTWFETSAKVNTNIDKAVNVLMKQMLENARKNENIKPVNEDTSVKIEQNQRRNFMCCS